MIKKEENSRRMKKIKQLSKKIGIDIPIIIIRGKVFIDVFEYDRKLSQHDLNYDYEKCMYLGKNISMAEYIEEKFGEEILKEVKELI